MKPGDRVRIWFPANAWHNRQVTVEEVIEGFNYGTPESPLMGRGIVCAGMVFHPAHFRGGFPDERSRDSSDSWQWGIDTADRFE